MDIRNEEIKFRVNMKEKETINSLCLRNEKLSATVRRILLEKAVDFESPSKRKIASYNSERLIIEEEINKLKLKIRALEIEDSILLEKVEKEIEKSDVNE